MADTVQVVGLNELLTKLKTLPAELASKRGGPVRAALFQAAKVVRDEARQDAPRRTGSLAANIVAKRNPHPEAHRANEEYGIMVSSIKRKYADTARNRRKGRVGKSYRVAGPAYYWRFLEFGTRKMTARPFLRPAFDRTKSHALDVFTRALASGIDKLVAKLGRA